MRVFDVNFDYKTDVPEGSGADPDRDSPRLRLDHELLWSKELPNGDCFNPRALSRSLDLYLVYRKDPAKRGHCYGSDAITSSYTTWTKPKALVDAIGRLNEDQRSRYLNLPYTIGSAMIWPVRTKDPTTMNKARGLFGQIADRMDLTLECIRRHYAGEPGSPLAGVTDAYADFFKLFDGFEEFVEFFHFQDLMDEHGKVEFYLPFDNFERHGTPATKEEYVTYRDAVLKFISKRGQRMGKWVKEHHPEIEVRL